jgi:hypothetical protein
MSFLDTKSKFYYFLKNRNPPLKLAQGSNFFGLITGGHMLSGLVV